ncbi:coiled-coil domain-containing protein 142 [Nilaparvata lugens]|uniref:coiled-coil domain-containing protein 142 n=1 Tax=Nilaparvata lugens TaxID=108931 RepID=UPI00193CCD90|nr:coiled-coil domain-containing protein 142 [Nilaparvata lugens]
MTPPAGCSESQAHATKSQPLVSDVPVLDSMLSREDLRLAPFLGTMSVTTPALLGPYAVKHTKSGHVKIRAKVRLKICDYYRQVLWGEVGTYLEHILLWWGNAPLGPQLPQHTNRLRNWLRNFFATNTLPELVRAPLQSLMDALCCHVTSTAWDLHFRRCLVAAAHQNSRHKVNNSGQGTWTGELFGELFAQLVAWSNSCEGSNWTLEDLEQLPLVEQIPVLHRLDHSVHTARNWAASRARQLANDWSIDQFFRVTQSDVNQALSKLKELMTSSQVELLSVESSVHVTVCCKMRGKLVSEVKANISKLEKVPVECVGVLAIVCRTFCLANLRMIFPPPLYWRQHAEELPQYATNYVEDYLEVVMRPVFLASSPFSVQVQQNVAGLVLHIMCEAWLDHITTHRIKFSEWGALQLLTDFGAVPTWVLERVTGLQPEVRRHLLNQDILRRCEGVGRLLLRRPGENIAMDKLPSRKMQQG